MKLHEYQSKHYLRAHGIALPEGEVIRHPEEARAACARLGGARWVVKAQVHAGGRGKAGGVVLADSPEQVEAEAHRLLGSTLATVQTGAAGLPVEALLIERPPAIARELYLSLLVDREDACLLFVASAAGGMDIETVAAQTPERILRLAVAPGARPDREGVDALAEGLGLEGAQRATLDVLLAGLLRLFIESDASLIEINPLVVTDAGELLALDTKIEIDDNALWRQPELAALRDPGQEDAREAQARAHDLNYIRLDGSIGCMVNGAGLAMATMDLVQRHGGAPANFLDVGGGTTAARVAEAFKLILSDDKVRAVLVNIFGGIVRCDLIAEGILQAMREVEVRVPVVVRLEGTRAEEGRAMLGASALALESAASLDEAAARVVALAGEGAA